MTKTELKEELVALGIEFDDDASKAELQELVEEAKGDTPDVDETEEEETEVEEEEEETEESEEEEKPAIKRATLSDCLKQLKKIAEPKTEEG